MVSKGKCRLLGYEGRDASKHPHPSFALTPDGILALAPSGSIFLILSLFPSQGPPINLLISPNSFPCFTICHRFHNVLRTQLCYTRI